MITVDGYPFDLVEKEQHDLEAEVTEHPVEDGSAISDNVIVKPAELTFTNAVVSDTPVGAIASDASRSGQLRFSRDAYARLEATLKARKTVVVVSNLKKYDSMILDKLSTPVESKDAGGLVFTVHFKQVVIVKNRRVTVAVPNLLGSQNLGSKGAHVHPAGVTYVRSASPTANLLKGGAIGPNADLVNRFGQPILTTTAAQRALTNGNTDDGRGTLNHFAVPEGQPIDGYVVDSTTQLVAKFPPGKKVPSDLMKHQKAYYRTSGNSHIPGYPSTGTDNTRKNKTKGHGTEPNAIINHVAGGEG